MTTRRSVRWLRKRASSERPFFLFLNYIEPHLEYDPSSDVRSQFLPESVSEQRLAEINQDPWRYVTGVESMNDEDFALLKSLYRAEISYVDRHLGHLYRCLDDNNLLDNTLIILVSDHGENIGDHELMDHQYGLFDTLTHVPLVIKPPTTSSTGMADKRGESIEHIVELRNLSATVVEATLGPEESNNVPGVSILMDDVTHGHAVSEYLVPQPAVETLEDQYDVDDISHLAKTYRALWSEEWKLIEVSDDNKKLYHIHEDPKENTDLSEASSDVTAKLSEQLTSIRGELTSTSAESQEGISGSTEQRLEDLGYL